jgi:chromosome segregation ATPase
MSCWILVLGFMLGAAVLGYMFAWFMQPANQQGAPKAVPNPQAKANNSAKTQKELDKIKKRYDELYDSKLDVDTALVAAESTLDGLKLDYERLERDLSGNNNRNKDLQADFDRYKGNKEDEIKNLRTKTKKATDNYETVKFQLAKSNRINGKLQESLTQLKVENENLSTELEEANEEIEVVNASMSELKDDYKDIKGKTEDYNDKLAEWQEKYKGLDLAVKESEEENAEISKAYESYQSSAGSEIEKLSEHLESLQTQLEESTSYTNEYAEAYSHAEADRQKLTQELEEQKKIAADELAEIKHNIEGLEQDYGAVQKREELLDDRFSNLQDKHSDLEEAFHSTVEEKENLQVTYMEYKETTSGQFAELEKEAKSWVNKLESSNLEMSQHKDKAAELEDNKKSLVQELEKTRKRYEKELSLSGGEFDALNDTFEGLKERYFAINKDLSSTKLEKDRISHEKESFQEQVMAELQLMRDENKKISKSLATVKAEKRMLQFSKEELEERIEEAESNAGGGSPKEQQKLLKMINRLRQAAQDQKEELTKFKKEKVVYQEKIEILEAQLQHGSNADTVTKLMGEPVGGHDDLKQIGGIEAMIEETLNDFGIYSYAQLANISNDNKELLSQVLSNSPKKIEKWAEKAEKLMP